jgi:methionyl-tRNA formyltransferase
VVQVYDAKKHNSTAGGTPGEVVAINANGMIVTARDGHLEIQRVRAAGAKISALDFASHTGLQPGARLGT